MGGGSLCDNNSFCLMIYSAHGIAQIRAIDFVWVFQRPLDREEWRSIQIMLVSTTARWPELSLAFSQIKRTFASIPRQSWTSPCVPRREKNEKLSRAPAVWQRQTEWHSNKRPFWCWLIVQATQKSLRCGARALRFGERDGRESERGKRYKSS